jgi:RND family efflux transporter MFP subunit
MIRRRCLPAVLALVVPAAAQAAPEMAVTVVTVSRRDLVLRLPVHGQFVAWREVVVANLASGLAAMEVLAEEGDVVAIGQPLLRLDAALPMAQHARARAALAEADAAAREAATALRRVDAMRGSGAVSAELLDQRRAAAASAAARMEAARAELTETVTRLNQTTVNAPVAGRILQRTVEVGSVPGIGDIVFRIAQNGVIEFDARVPDHALVSIRAGQVVTVASGGMTRTGQVRAVAPRVDPATRLGTVHVRFADTGDLRPGSFGSGTILLDERQGALVVPQAAVAVRGNEATAVVVQGGRARHVPVRLGVRANGVVEIQEGLVEGDEVVATAAALVRDGAAVAAVRVAPRPAQAASRP